MRIRVVRQGKSRLIKEMKMFKRKKKVVKVDPPFTSVAAPVTLPSNFFAPHGEVKERPVESRFVMNSNQGGLLAEFGVQLSDLGDEIVFLEVTTPNSRMPIQIARLEFKGGKVAMYRETGAFDPYIVTDAEGRIEH
jgi:hypothetical protein